MECASCGWDSKPDDSSFVKRRKAFSGTTDEIVPAEGGVKGMSPSFLVVLPDWLAPTILVGSKNFLSSLNRNPLAKTARTSSCFVSSAHRRDMGDLAFLRAAALQIFSRRLRMPT
jgi:hypothetical protein